MLGIPQGWVSRWHGTPTRNAGTSQNMGAVYICDRGVWWKVGARVCILVLLINLLLSPHPVETKALFIELNNPHLPSESKMWKSPPVLLVAERASSSMVRTIMALLATFDEAKILPPEGTPQANQVIHGLIQLQSALMKSPSSDLAAYRNAAVTHWTQHNQPVRSLTEEGLTDKMLAALVAYNLQHPLWEDQKIVEDFQEFNVTRADWKLIVGLFNKAEVVFRNQGRTIHQVYETWRMSMSGEKS